MGQVKFLGRAYELGFEKEKNYKGCAQCTLAALFELTGKKEETLFQASSGLSGGVGLNGDGPCGGYIGAVLFMGTYAGRRLKLIGGDKEAQYRSYAMAQKLHDKFVETYGSIGCSGVQQRIFGRSFCLRTKVVREEFEAAGAHQDKCTSVVATASMWTAMILHDEGLI